MRPDARIAVVGAGMAGMSAARALAATGVDVIVFDKARGAGGRMATRRHETGAFDHGAQYFTARSDAFRAQVDDWCGRGVAARWDAKPVRLGADGDDAERDPEARYVGVPTMSSLARDLADEPSGRLEVVCGEQVAGIRRRREGWRVVTVREHEAGAFDAVVLATPAPQTLPLLAEIPDTPALSALREALGAVVIDPCQAVLASFGARVSVPFDAAFVSDSSLAWVARNGSKPGRPEAECWVLHGSPDWSQRHVEASPEDITVGLLTAFEAAIGQRLPDTLHAASHRWLYARTRTSFGRESEWVAEAGIGICGDWMRGSRVEDAFLSGRHLAHRMLEASD